MTSSSIRLALAAFALAGTLSAVGCESTSRGDSEQNAHVLQIPTGQERGTRAPAATVAEERPAARQAERAPTRTTGGCAVDVPAGMQAATMAFPTGDPASSALMLTEVAPRQVRAGSNYQTEVWVCNLTNGVLQNVVLTQEQISNFEVSASSPAASRANDGSLIWTMGSLGPGESKKVVLQGKAGEVGQATTCMSVTYNNSLCSTVQIVQPALAITKAITPQAILNCDPISMNIEVRNTGSGAAENVKITDNLPEGLTTTDGQRVVSINVGTLAAGESKPYTVALKAARTGKFDNTASVVADGGLTADSQTVSTVVTQPVLTIACKSPERVFLGREVAYQFTVTNTGDAACDNTTVAVTLPGGATGVRMSDNGTAGTWNLGTLAPKASKVLTVNFTPTGGAGSSVSVSATVACKCAAPATTTCSTNVFGLPDIGTLVTDDDGVVAVGANHTYRVEVDNQGQIPLTNVKMVVTLPEGMTFVSSAVGKLIGGNKVEFDFGTVAPGQRPIASFMVKSNKAGELLVVGETTCSEIRTPIRDDELTVFVGE